MNGGRYQAFAGNCELLGRRPLEGFIVNPAMAGASLYTL